jgi:hypothetical protein
LFVDKVLVAAGASSTAAARGSADVSVQAAPNADDPWKEAKHAAAAESVDASTQSTEGGDPESGRRSEPAREAAWPTADAHVQWEEPGVWLFEELAELPSVTGMDAQAAVIFLSRSGECRQEDTPSLVAGPAANISGQSRAVCPSLRMAEAAGGVQPEAGPLVCRDSSEADTADAAVQTQASALPSADIGMAAKEDPDIRLCVLSIDQLNYPVQFRERDHSWNAVCTAFHE